MTNISIDRLARFEAKTTPVTECGCVIWLASVNEHGYGVFWNGQKLEKAHRFALRASGVKFSAADDVLHRCDVPACVNPAHLFVGDAKANVADMWSKSRATVQYRRGTAQSQAKLSDEKAAAIRALVSSGMKQRAVADLYDVSQRLVWNVVHRKNWFAESGVVVARGCGR